MTDPRLTAAASSIEVDRLGSADSPKLLVIHGIGSMRLCWSPVVGDLAKYFDVVVVDLPGFGKSPVLAADLAADARGFAEVLAALMDSLGWKTAHLLGNSLGGWISFELALMGRAGSITALAPAGIWKTTSPLNTRLVLVANRYSGKAARPILGILKRDRIRKVVLGSLFGNPLLVPGDHAVLHAQGFADNHGWKRVVPALKGKRFEGGEGITVPITVVFGGKDPLIRRNQSDLTVLPAHTRYETPPTWGHVPMYDDPEGIVRLVRETSGV